MRRDILTWRILDTDLVGTYHIPTESRTGSPSGTHRTGVLLLNSGPAPRSGNSDLPVHIGDRLSSRGIPVFRFDLPGLGDSSGTTPAEFNTYWQEVLCGRNDDVTYALIVKLLQQFGFSRVIVGGLCAAAIPMLRVAGSHVDSIAGVILMEPALRFGENIIPNFPQSNMATVLPVSGRTKLRKLFSVREWLRYLTGNSRVATMLRPLRPLLVRIQLLLFGHTLYGDMNVPLFMHWRDSHARGMHSFVAVAEGQDMDRCVSCALDSLPTNGPRMVTLIRVPQTNHIFTSGHARDIILDAVEQWSVAQCKIDISAWGTQNKSAELSELSKGM
jgi:pimeloyl-ACP methyl ester carboxylesterase